MSAIPTVLDRNRRFAAERFPAGLTIMPRLRLIVVGCLDPRVDPAHLLGLEPGEAAVVRNVGGRVTPAVLETLDLLALGFPALTEAPDPQDRMDLVVLQHDQCGITRMQGAPRQLAASFGIPESELPGKAVGDPRAAVAVDVGVLAAHPGIAAAYTVSGLVYDVTTGLVEVVVPAGLPA